MENGNVSITPHQEKIVSNQPHTPTPSSLSTAGTQAIHSLASINGKYRIYRFTQRVKNTDLQNRTI